MLILLAGKKPDAKTLKDIKILVSFFDAAIPAPVNTQNHSAKVAAGGYILETPSQQQSRVRDLTRVIETQFLQEVTKDTTQALNDN